MFCRYGLGTSFHYPFFKNNNLWLNIRMVHHTKKERIKVKAILNLSSIPTVCFVYAADSLSHLVQALFLGLVAQNVFLSVLLPRPCQMAAPTSAHGTGGKRPLPPCFGSANWELGRDSCCKHYKATCLLSTTRPSLATKTWKTGAGLPCHVMAAASTLFSSSDSVRLPIFCSLIRLAAPTLKY